MVLLQDVVKIYRTSGGELKALDGVTLQVRSGEFLVVHGPSGSGKTTLLMIVAAMLRPTSGAVTVAGHHLERMSNRERADFRARTIGYVFQMFHLVPYLNVIENVLFAAGATGARNVEARGLELLRQLAMQERIRHRPSELSAGERQRTAIARALLNNPKILLADEPTGNLDRESSSLVFTHLSNFHKKGGTVVVASHDIQAESYADRVVSLLKGRVVS